MLPGLAELVAHQVPWIYLPSIWHFFVLGDLPRAEQGVCHGLAEQEVMSLKPQLQQKCKEDGEVLFCFCPCFVAVLIPLFGSSLGSQCWMAREPLALVVLLKGRLVPLGTPRSELRDVFWGVGSGLPLRVTLPCQQGSASPPKKSHHVVSVALFLCFLLCFQGERGMPGLPGRHGMKVPCKQRSAACLPDLPTPLCWP